MGCEAADSRMIIMHPLYLPRSSPWLDVKVFYVRVSNYEINESTPENLTVSHIPLTPETILEINGRRASMCTDCMSSVLRRDRADKRSEEATFVSTDSIRMTGSVKFEVYDGGNMFFSGVVELNNGNGSNRLEDKSHDRKWNMRCESVRSNDHSFLNEKHMNTDSFLPVIEVYVAGSFLGTPIILSRTIQLGQRKKRHMSLMLDSIPEYNTTGLKRELQGMNDFKVAGYEDNTSENDLDLDYRDGLSEGDYIEDGELSWFNAGVKVGVGISLGICLGVGLGVGLLVRTYRATTRNFKRRFV